MQDKDIDYNLKFVCFDTKEWIGNGYLIPAGPLREKIDSLKKYDAVFLKGKNSETDEIIELIRRYNSSIKIFFSDYIPVNLDEFKKSNRFIIFSGIANPSSFKDLIIKNNLNIVKELIFSDHYKYKYSDVKKIIDAAESLNAQIIKTEKDFVKIQKFETKKINFLKIKLKIENEDELINFLKTEL